MTFVYPNTLSTFKGDRAVALSAGYMEIEDAVYADLVETKKMWQASGESYVIVDDPTYEARKQAEEEEAERQRQAKIITDEVNQLKKNLTDTDYAIIKIAEGVATKEEYATVIANRATWRARINELEN